MNYRLRKRNGLAMMLVLSVLAFVAVMGFAMLSGAALQAQSSRNSSLAVEADALAESGIDLAYFYLLYPHRAPSPPAKNSLWGGATGITFGASVPGSVDVVVTSLGSGNYSVQATGKRAGADGAVVKRQANATAHVDPGFQMKAAAATAGNTVLSLYTTINGDLQSGGNITNNGKITGTAITSNAPLGTGIITGGWTTPTSNNTSPVPNSSKLTDYSTYKYQGVTYSAATITTLASNTTLGPTPTNPAGIYKCTGNLNMGSNVTINGTLIVEGGVLNVNGGNNFINPASGFPAAILKSDLVVVGPGTPRNVSFNGLTWVGGAVKSSGVITNAAYVDFNASVLFGGSSSISLTFLGKVDVSSDPEKVVGVELDKTVTPAAVTVLSYKQ